MWAGDNTPVDFSLWEVEDPHPVASLYTYYIALSRKLANTGAVASYGWFSVGDTERLPTICEQAVYLSEYWAVVGYE